MRTFRSCIITMCYDGQLAFYSAVLVYHLQWVFKVEEDGAWWRVANTVWDLDYQGHHLESTWSEAGLEMFKESFF